LKDIRKIRFDSLTADVKGGKSGTLAEPSNFPNPSSGGLHLAFTVKEPGKVIITIANMTGTAVRKLTVQATSGEQQIYWDGKDETGKDVAPGTYIYELRCKNEVRTGKVAIVR